VATLLKNLVSSNHSFHGLKKSSNKEGTVADLVNALVDIKNNL